MNVVYNVLLGIHVLIALVMIITVLLQSGKGGGLAGAFGGGGGSQAIFGGRGAATFLGKATTVLGTAFMLLSLALAVLQGQDRTQSALEREAARAASQAPALPAPGAGPVGLPGAELPGGEGAGGEGETGAGPAPPTTPPAAPAGETSPAGSPGETPSAEPPPEGGGG